MPCDFVYGDVLKTKRSTIVVDIPGNATAVTKMGKWFAKNRPADYTRLKSLVEAGKFTHSNIMLFPCPKGKDVIVIPYSKGKSIQLDIAVLEANVNKLHRALEVMKIRDIAFPTLANKKAQKDIHIQMGACAKILDALPNKVDLHVNDQFELPI